MEKLEQIITTYQQIIQKTELELQNARKRIYYISLLRLILFVGAVANAIIFWSDGWLCLSAFAVLPFILFIWLVKRHNFWFYRKDFLKKKIEINEQELRAMQYDFSDFDDGKEFINPSHLYTLDLDVFGEHSLFQYINRTATPIGKQHLANWFNAHLEEKEAIEQRQEAIRELSSELEFRQQFRLLGLLYKGKPSDTSAIKEWVNSPSDYRKHAFLRILPTAVGIINLLCIGATILGFLPASISGIVFACFVVFSFIFSKGITKIQATYGEKLQILSTYADQILITEKKEMHSPALQQLKAELTSQNQTASQSVHRLAKLMNALDQRGNLLMSTILNGLLFWELRQVMQIEKWKEAHSADLPRWIEAIGAIDAYCSLATFSYNHPDYIYPQITSQSFHLQAEALGHPLMDRNKCVRNGIDMEKRPFFIIITGANMAGKSTYLRTVGVNYLLACIGAPVWAAKMEIFPARLVTSLRTSDSLTDNESYFFAELKRLKLIIDKLKAGEDLFIILDEILKGTNSMDKQKGSFALIKQFMSMDANGIIATHDLLLGTLIDAFPQNIRNYCFEADITNNELTFSYQMRSGVAQNMNACFLMKKMGIAVIDG
jgi:DNA mismatch repair ATPase MutS